MNCNKKAGNKPQALSELLDRLRKSRKPVKYLECRHDGSYVFVPTSLQIRAITLLAEIAGCSEQCAVDTFFNEAMLSFLLCLAGRRDETLVDASSPEKAERLIELAIARGKEF